MMSKKEQNEIISMLPDNIEAINGLTKSAKLVLGLMVQFNCCEESIKNGYFYCSFNKISQELQMSRSTVIRAVTTLLKKELIKRVEDDTNRAASYMLNFDDDNGVICGSISENDGVILDDDGVILNETNGVNDTNNGVKSGVNDTNNGVILGESEQIEDLRKMILVSFESIILQIKHLQDQMTLVNEILNDTQINKQINKQTSITNTSIDTNTYCSLDTNTYNVSNVEELKEISITKTSTSTDSIGDLDIVLDESSYTLEEDLWVLRKHPHSSTPTSKPWYYITNGEYEGVSVQSIQDFVKLSELKRA